jgi:LPS sulfotransferase NodH
VAVTPGAEHDLPEYAGRPRSYIIASTPRTGSNLLCGLLRGTGLAGAPLEYFNPGHMRSLLERLDSPTPAERLRRWRRRNTKGWTWLGIEGWGEREIQHYVRLVQRRRTTPNGVFGTKAHHRQVERVFLERGFAPEDFLEAPPYVHLTRRDPLAQAISWLKARQSWSWQRAGDASKTRFDFDLLHERLERIRRQEDGWKRYFAERGIEPLRLVYEEMVEDLDGSIRRALDWFGVDAPPDLKVPAPTTRKLADEESRRWADLYREEEARRSSGQAS